MSKVTFALGASVIGLALGTSSAASAATLKADYQFQDTLASSVPGAPALTNAGPEANSFDSENVLGSFRRVLTFPKNNGLSLSSTNSIIRNDSYSIVMLFRLVQTDGYARLLDVANATTDNGFYDLNRTLVLYPVAEGTAPPTIAPDTYVQVVFTRDASGTVRGYVNGTETLGPYDDSTSRTAVITPDNVLRFFIDDPVFPNEDSAGAVARIRIYAGALTPQEVAALQPSAPPPPPVLGKSFDAAPVSGVVLVRFPQRGTGQKGFVQLTSAGQLPTGTQVDSRRGMMKLTAASPHSGRTQAADFGGAVFSITQNRHGVGLTTLKLLQGVFPGTSCGKAKALDGAPWAQAARYSQTLRSRGHGHFRGSGRYSAATVRGTIWSMTDGCNGTLTKVTRGTVVVNDFVRHVRVVVQAGHQYLALPRRHR